MANGDQNLDYDYSPGIAQIMAKSLRYNLFEMASFFITHICHMIFIFWPPDCCSDRKDSQETVFVWKSKPSLYFLWSIKDDQNDTISDNWFNYLETT